jgi:DNA repair exonuclease SbcCD nuclease subunit
MIEKVIQISDIHLKCYMGHENARAVFEKLFYDIDNIQPDRIVITGDIVDNYNQLTPELVNMINYLIDNLIKRAKVIVIPGNHDYLETNKDRLDSLSPIIESKENVFYFKKSDVYEDENINWCVFSIMDGNEKPNIPKDNSKVNIGLFHGIIEGSKIDTGMTFNRGLPPGYFSDCDCVLAGDVHKRQVFEYEGGFIIMCGSLHQLNFGEDVDGHGYTILHIPSLKYEFYDIKAPVKYLKLQVNDYEEVFNDKETVINENNSD